MSVFDAPEYDDHERVVFCRDARAGLRAIIALHDTTLGPAAGGCRMRAYGDERAALGDVLRLSRGMSYKNAMAGLPLGGGKSVIIADPLRDKTEGLLESFGEHVESLNGAYVTAEDSGVSLADVEIIRRRTRHAGGVGSDPSPVTAYGVYLGILATVGFRVGEPRAHDLRGIRVAVQGLGAVGHRLCSQLHRAGAELLVADIDPQRVARASREFDAEPVDCDGILRVDADVLAPCALGAVLNARTVPDLQVSIVAGAANNQLDSPADGAALFERDILYAPDYVINAGGIIHVAYEHLGLGPEAEVHEALERIGPRLVSIFEASAQTGRSPDAVADAMAARKLEQAGAARRDHAMRTSFRTAI